jgi:hypothetical protein
MPTYAKVSAGACSPALYLTHDDIEVLDVDAAHIQFTNDSPQNSLPAGAFVRKTRALAESPQATLAESQQAVLAKSRGWRTL